ncbi:WhiB family transcriptional regulator [Nocardioides marmoriginsengisoli]|uniref:Transcriptional regulator WhiB n=1 Tax=Nocardioides marmoriginsengisoli TaxID=661483 RepID=A0A3N0CEN2_9ACTN|nr:WhiB family transcriptional regulator [Nocardioides marmoriginsengisoli]RNL61905.1 WhiB family transcriptional regulator [Nocardioides marmoriginsengisoli]
MTATAAPVASRLRVPEDSDWTQAAACADEDPELFFPVGEKGTAPAQLELARAVCLGCPVVEPCLQFALDVGVTDGMWGATSPRERRAMTGRRNPRYYYED